MQDITLYMWATPNSRRIAILFEELALNYKVEGVNIRAKEQFAANIVALNPFAKVPIAVWHENDKQRVQFESGAILISAADHHQQFLPHVGKERDEVMQWLMVALTALGPHSAQAHHWSCLAPEKPQAAIDHHVNQAIRVYDLLEQRLGQQAYLADEYSIADMAAYPWVSVIEWTTLELKNYPNIADWYRRIGIRPAVQKAMNLPDGIQLD